MKAYEEPNAFLRNDIAHFGRGSSVPATRSMPTPSPTQSAIVVRVDEGFDWLSAAVGAAGGFGLLLLGGGAASALRRRHTTAAALDGR
jgi:hypothetical protein